MSDNTGVLIEDMRDNMAVMVEAISVLAQDMAVVKSQVALIPEMSDDIKAIKAVQREQGKDLRHITDYLIGQGMPTRA
jgi:archaellum component FlaC